MKTLHIKNMVCNRCIRVVREELEKIGMDVHDVKLGEVELDIELNSKQLEEIKKTMLHNGFELIDDKRVRMIEKIKTLIIRLIHQDGAKSKGQNYSDIIINELHHDYSYLSNLFSTAENLTIEKYIILQKIERVKELLVYDELTLNEIAYQMGYSSVQHLSKQFKNVTGLTPSHYKQVKENKRNTLDTI